MEPVWVIKHEELHSVSSQQMRKYKIVGIITRCERVELYWRLVRMLQMHLLHSCRLRTRCVIKPRWRVCVYLCAFGSGISKFKRKSMFLFPCVSTLCSPSACELCHWFPKHCQSASCYQESSQASPPGPTNMLTIVMPEPDASAGRSLAMETWWPCGTKGWRGG